MTSSRIDELLKQTAYPESASVRQAILQVWNELQQKFNSRICRNCEYFIHDDRLDRCVQGVNDGSDYTNYQVASNDVVEEGFGCNKYKIKEL